MSDFLTRRNGTWHFVRRVPVEFAAFDRRGIIRHSTKVRVAKLWTPLKACSSWPSESFRAGRPTSIRHVSWIVTRKPLSRCSRKSKPACRYPASMPRRAVNLMEALRGSIARENASTALQKRPRRIDGQGEMLLRIAGKKGKQTTAKPAERASARQENAG